MILWYDFTVATLLGVLFVLAMFVLAVVGYRRGWGGGKRTAPVTNTGHHRDLWDAAPWRCVHGVAPHKVTHLCAWPTGHDLNRWPTEPTAEQRGQRVPISNSGR